MRTETMSWAVRGAGLAVGVGLVLLLAFLAGAARDILLLVFLAVLLGAALEPVVGHDPGPTGIGRGLSILIVYATFLVARRRRRGVHRPGRARPARRRLRPPARVPRPRPGVERARSGRRRSRTASAR